MKRRNFLKGIVAASVGLAFAPVNILSDEKPKVLFGYRGFELRPYVIYYDGKNRFMAVSNSEIININQNESNTPVGPLIPIASVYCESYHV